MSGFQDSLDDGDVERRGNQYFVGGKLVGWRYVTPEGVRVYISPRNRKRHLHVKKQGWGISIKLLAMLKEDKVETVELKVEGEGYLTAPLSRWIELGEFYQAEGYEPQHILLDSQLHKTET